MTLSRDPDRLIHAFLMEGEEELHDQVYDAVRAVIEQKPQRAGFGSWRELSMNKFLAIGLGAAAVIAVLLIGTNLLGGGSPPPGGAPSDSAAPSEPASSASPAGPADGSLPVGEPFAWSDGSDGGVPVTVTPPADGWFGQTGWFALEKNEDLPDYVAVVVFNNSTSWLVPGNPCDAESTMPDAPSATVDEFVAALSAQQHRDAMAPVDITVDGHAGKSITVHVPDPLPAECVDAQFCSFVDPALTSGPPEDACARSHQGPGQIDELYIVVVDGNLIVLDAAYWEGTSAALIEEERAIIDSVSFE